MIMVKTSLMESPQNDYMNILEIILLKFYNIRYRMKT